MSKFSRGGQKEENVFFIVCPIAVGQTEKTPLIYPVNYFKKHFILVCWWKLKYPPIPTSQKKKKKIHLREIKKEKILKICFSENYS